MIVLRSLLGLSLVALAIWVILGEQITSASANATINARLVTMRAPVAGDVNLQPRLLGARVTRGEVLATVDDRLVDAVRLDDLILERRFTEAELTRLDTLIDETEAIMAGLEDRTDQYRAQRLNELETRLSFARERLEILQNLQNVQASDDEEATLPGNAAMLRPAMAPDLPELWVNYAQEQVQTLEIEVRAAQGHVFLGDGYNDAPHAEQRLTELQSDRASLTAQQAEARTRLASLTLRQEAEQRRVNRFRGAELVAPVAGLYWETLAASGENIQRGDPVVRLLACDTTVVTLSVTERVYNSLSIGDAAVFRPRGSQRNFEGTVTRLAGAGAATFYRNLAIAPSQEHLDRFDVTVTSPELTRDPDHGCAVGRTGRVFFDRRPLDWLRDLWSGMRWG